jgi:hypothetical protein
MLQSRSWRGCFDGNGLTLLLCVAAWLCKWGNEIRWEVLFWGGWLGLCWVWSVGKWFEVV